MPHIEHKGFIILTYANVNECEVQLGNTVYRFPTLHCAKVNVTNYVKAQETKHNTRSINCANPFALKL